MWIVAFLAALGTQDAVEAKRGAALKTFKDKVHPFLEAYCIKCHGTRPKGGVTLVHLLKSPATPAFSPLWKRVAGQVKAHTMPPEDAAKQPKAGERAAVMEWIDGIKYLSPKDPGEFVIRRLNRVEYGNTLRDLLGVEPGLAEALPEEVFGAGYANSVSPLLMEKYLAIAGEAIGKMTRRDLLEGTDAREVARTMARRAYRRPPADAEVDLLMKVHALAKGRSEEEARRLMLKAVLVSPQFLFITPGGDVPSQPIVALDDHQLAARLSYFLWSSPPDAELSRLADAGKLRENLAAQARRLLADPRSRALFDGFGRQWLGLDKLAGKTFDPAKFPQMSAALKDAMVEEARLFFESVLRDDRSLATLIEADYTFVNETLAPLYGLKAEGPEMRRVAVSGDRGGILTMPGVLAQTSFPNRTSPVNRGAWVLEHVLGEHVPPPPADVPALDDQKKEEVAALTLRQRTELHRTNPTCASCHKVLDPIGFGLENFDAIGRWRDRDDSGGPIDAAGELPGERRFRSPKELKAIVAARIHDVARTLAGRLLAYALCRQLVGYDEVVVDGLAEQAAQDGYKLQGLVVGVVTSYPFTHRRVHDLKGAAHGK
ncbi:MAG TPA: DUF1592 domain-containing protein [Planctomycetota bacterium]|nr:DUF1592 domain-containing protein [Planctomycetota bacterium]